MRKSLLLAAALVVCASPAFAGPITVDSLSQDATSIDFTASWDGNGVDGTSFGQTNWIVTLGGGNEDPGVEDGTFSASFQHTVNPHGGEGLGELISWSNQALPSYGQSIVLTELIPHPLTDGMQGYDDDSYRLEVIRAADGSVKFIGMGRHGNPDSISVPEPSSMALLGLSSLVGGFLKLRRRKNDVIVEDQAC